MAIKLYIDRYCENCTDFEPVKIDNSYYDGTGRAYITKITIQCEYRNRCRNIHDYFELEKKNEKNN